MAVPLSFPLFSSFLSCSYTISIRDPSIRVNPTFRLHIRMPCVCPFLSPFFFFFFFARARVVDETTGDPAIVPHMGIHYKAVVLMCDWCVRGGARVYHFAEDDLASVHASVFCVFFFLSTT